MEVVLRIIILATLLALGVGAGETPVVLPEKHARDSADVAASLFGDARWLWPAELGAATNTVVEFRQTFAADQASSARLAIAADTVYRVELNGRAVYWGRFPDVPPQRFYDVLSLNDVRAGENELKVSVYAQGDRKSTRLNSSH